jgi:hypothetical protein
MLHQRVRLPRRLPWLTVAVRDAELAGHACNVHMPLPTLTTVLILPPAEPTIDNQFSCKNEKPPKGGFFFASPPSEIRSKHGKLPIHEDLIR